MFVHIGSYTDGEGGITLARQDPGSGALDPVGVVAETPSPSFLAWHPDGRHLYAVNETKDGTVTAYEAGVDGRLRELNTQPTGGAEPCHLVVHPTGRHLLTANYGGGSITVHSLHSDGSIGPRTDLVRHQGHGPDKDRQEGPHAHHVRVTPDGEYVLAVDLGLDSVFVYRLDPVSGKLAPHGAGRTAPGAGPRHLVFGPEGTVHVACELDSTVTSFSYDAGSLVRTGATPSTVEKGNSPSEIVLGPDGRFVYLANRGRDVLTVFDESTMEISAEVPAGGRWPRHLAIIDRYLYVANQHTHQVVCFRLDPRTGVPEPTGATLDVPSPACVSYPTSRRTVVDTARTTNTAA